MKKNANILKKLVFALSQLQNACKIIHVQAHRHPGLRSLCAKNQW